MANGQQPSQQQANQAAQQYGVHRHFQNVQTQQQATNQADQQVNAQTKDSWIFGPFAPIMRKLAEDQATTQYNDKLPGEVKNLKQGLSIRSAPGFQLANYQGYSHDQLHQMVTQGVDPGSVGSVGDTWLEMGDDLTQFQDQVASALAKSETTWQGTAGNNARKSVADLGNKGASAGQAAQLAGTVTHQQSQALANARNSMPPPPNPPFNVASAQQQLHTITDPFAFATQAAADQKAFSDQQAAQQQAAHVVREYDTTVSQTSQNMPAFAPAPATAKKAPPPGNTPPPVGPPGTPVGGTGGGSFGPRTLPGSGSTGGGTSGTGSAPSGAPISGTGPQPVPVGQTSTSDYTPPGQYPGGTPGGAPGGGGYPSGPGGTGPGTSDMFGGGVMPPMGGGGGLGGLGGDIPRGGGGFGPGGSGGGAGGAGRGFGPGGSGSSGGNSGSGSGARSGAGAAAAEEAAVERGAAGARGASGTSGGMAPGARGGSKGGQDAEHKRASYLVESDPNEIFGSDEKTAPPVIG